MLSELQILALAIIKFDNKVKQRVLLEKAIELHGMTLEMNVHDLAHGLVRDGLIREISDSKGGRVVFDSVAAAKQAFASNSKDWMSSGNFLEVYELTEAGEHEIENYPQTNKIVKSMLSPRLV